MADAPPGPAPARDDEKRLRDEWWFGFQTCFIIGAALALTFAVVSQATGLCR